VLIHELAHCAVARHYGAEITNISLWHAPRAAAPTRARRAAARRARRAAGAFACRMCVLHAAAAAFAGAVWRLTRTGAIVLCVLPARAGRWEAWATQATAAT
jgi:hypothetical protein